MSNWYDSLPAPIAKPGSISSETLKEMMETAVVGKDYIVVDVRRADIEAPLAFFHPSAINLPAHSFHQTLPNLFPFLSQAKLVIFHCNSSNGRGPRCAAWYQDFLNERKIGSETTQALVLAGGIKAWAAAFPDDVVKV